MGLELPGVHDERGRCTGESPSTLLSCILTRSTDTMVARSPSPFTLSLARQLRHPSFGRFHSFELPPRAPLTPKASLLF